MLHKAGYVATAFGHGKARMARSSKPSSTCETATGSWHVDLEKFFDRVNHDILMDRLAKRIADKRVLRLIRRYLEAGVMSYGLVQSGPRRSGRSAPGGGG